MGYIGRTFEVKGLVDVRVVKIMEEYFLGGRKRYPSFRCEVVQSKLNEGIGNRENFLVRDVVKGGELINSIRVLAR